MAKWTDQKNEAGEITRSDRACGCYSVRKADGRWKCWHYPLQFDQSSGKIIGVSDNLSAAQMLCRDHLDRVLSANAGASAPSTTEFQR